MAITERQKDILKAIIREHIHDAAPVGSKTLADKYDFGIGPAMIRQEMAALEEDGYITQPHTSAGRVPTDKAYRFYISHIERGGGADRESGGLSSFDQKRVDTGLNAHADWHEVLKELSRVVADISGELSISGLTSGEVRYTHGFSQLARDPELADPQQVTSLFRFMDEMDSYFDSLWRNALEDSFGVLIGKENPVKEIQSFSVITGTYQLPQEHAPSAGSRSVSGTRPRGAAGRVGFVSIIGPRRMDYRKNVALVRYVAHKLESGSIT